MNQPGPAAPVQFARVLFDALAEGVVWHGPDGKVIDANAAAAPILGLTREELLGRSPHDPRWYAVHEDGSPWPGGEHPSAVALRTGQPQRGRIMGIIAPGAGRRWISIHAMPIFGDDRARPAGVITSFVDVTERIDLANRLQRLADEQAAILDNELVGIARLRKRTIVWNNRAFDRLLGYQGRELTGASTQVLYPDRAAFDAFGKNAYSALRRGEVFRTELQLRRKDGALIWADCSGFMVDPKAEEAIWFSTDITAQRAAHELRLRAAELEAENRQWQETARLQSLFLANMSHELRTPLNAVIGFAELLRLDPAPEASPQRERYLDQILASACHLLASIESMLDVAKAQKRGLDFRPGWIDLRSAVAEAVAMLEGQWRARGVTVVVEVSPELPRAHLDPLRLRQVLIHYLGNAIKFSHPGGRVEVRLRPAGGGRFAIEVQDQGIGIAAVDLPRLFSQFHQVSTGSTKGYEGVGIGLALLKLIVEAQGGTVAVRSDPGAGSTFSATLPLNADGPAEGPSLAAAAI